ncbi:MAG TPA: ornithine cyclodeaminase family protein [Candidatus Acidoferrales bacterium]|nr:ornithine cyclodeaminase family protein [Candidatus Acidoferrales bacterium]
MSFLLLRPQDLEGLIGMAEAIDIIELAYRSAAAYPVINSPRRRVHSPAGVRISTFAGGVHELGVIAINEHTELVNHTEAVQQYPYREHPVYVLHSSTDGRLLAIIVGEIDEKTIGYTSAMALRTAATSGVGFRLLARKDVKTAGIYGTGGMALNHLLALKCVRPIQTAKVYSRDAAHRREFAEVASRLCQVEIVPVENPREVMRGVDVVVVATNSNSPVFQADWIEPGQHVTGIIGSNVSLLKGGWLKQRRREIDDQAMQRFDVIMVNMREAIIQDEQGDIFEPIEKGLLKWEQIHEIGEVLHGQRPARTSDEQITLHKNNVGLGIADAGIAMRAYELAKGQGRGLQVDVPFPGGHRR